MIRITLNVVMAQRNMTTSELAKRVGITPTNISILKTGKAKAIRFSTLERFVPSWIVSRVTLLVTLLISSGCQT